MVKLIFCLRRKPGMSPQDFRDYWANHHAPLVQKHARALGIQRYVQSYTLPSSGFSRIADARGAPEAFDGVAELWFTSTSDMKERGATEEGRAAGRALLEDEARFIDLARSPLWISEEKEFL
ncbi:conserved hypothetical protein [Marinobacter daqiaonensis]|uniref:EthD domain-containing protein n=2 Tax=Marinobacter daqiaonensis TaxID=650891 RepID=A0A1I6IN94_9GAMM|nr:EthD domain-containing protein [Marinobacter daqiaonensis]SFR68121.1 conserved hypothetical protein [Marinobacter daqiaonensis]